MMQLAMYKGPAMSFQRRITHALIRYFTHSKYSHCELAINGICHSSSNLDGGVRAKVIDLESGRWDVYPIEGDTAAVLDWFEHHDGLPYDVMGVARFAVPFLSSRPDRWFCSEACAAALGLQDPANYSPQRLLDELVSYTSPRQSPILPV